MGGSIQVSAKAPSYVQQQYEWSIESGHPCPDQLTLTLIRGIRIGGRVSDESGQPLPGVVINAMYEALLPRPSGGGDYYVGRALDTVETDARGRWSVDGIPGTYQSLTASFTHPEYRFLRLESRSPNRDPRMQFTADALNAEESVIVLIDFLRYFLCSLISLENPPSKLKCSRNAVRTCRGSTSGAESKTASNSADFMIPLIGRNILLNFPSEARQRNSLPISRTAALENSRTVSL